MTAGWHIPETTRLICVLCGDDEEASMALVRYRDGKYGSVPRCKDSLACRRRTEANGDEWPIDEEGRR